jgi:hypothetical protein
MDDLQAIFERQAAWQRSRARLSWAEKLRMSLVMREARLAMKQPAAKAARGTGSSTVENRKDREES